MEGLVGLLDQKSLIVIIGLAVFFYVYKYSQGIFDWIEQQTIGTRTFILEKCEILMIEVNPDKVTFGLLGLSLGGSAITFALFGVLINWIVGIILAVVVGFFAFKVPKPIMNKLVERRVKKYEGQMVDGLTLLANGLRAGLSVPQSLSMVVDEMPDPISAEFNLVLQQNRIGVPIEECFDNLAGRVQTQDNDMFVSSINILRETGGNLAETFDTIVGVIRERVRLKQKVETLVAQGLFQGYTIAAMPFVIGGIFASSDPGGMTKMLTHPLGIFMIFLAVVSDAIGLFVIMKIVKVKT